MSVSLDKEGKVCSPFLDTKAINDGKADKVVSAIKSVIAEKNVQTDGLCGLDTDGAAVMTGREYIYILIV